MKHNATYWFVFSKSDLLLQKLGPDLYTIPSGDTPPTALEPNTTIHTISVPMLGDAQAKAYSIDSNVALDSDMEMCGLRPSYYKLPRAFYLAAGKCREIIHWDQTTRYCGTCGSPMHLHTPISKRCPHCGNEVWPQLATAVIVLIHRGDEVLMVHANNFRGKFYGLVAGFVETGETLEEAVVREVSEEVGITIEDIRYFGSQPWPFPCGLMVGFTAQYAGGDIRLQRSELASGGWYHKDHLPQLPEKLSIARQLIDHWLEKRQQEQE